MLLGCLPLLPGNKDDYLRKAAQEGNLKPLRKLLDAGVPADPRKAHHTSALQLAARGGHVECVKALIDGGADINRVADGTALLDAAAHGHVDTVKLLLDNKADAALAVNGNTAIHLAARSGHQSVIDILAPQLDMSSIAAAGNGEGKTPLMLACSQPQNADACVGYLLSIGSDPAAEDLAGNTALHYAGIAGNLAAANLLLASGARGVQAQHMVNNKGRTPLHLAALFGHQAVVELLASQDKADGNVKDKEGSTVLHMVCKSVMCAMSGQYGMAKALLEHGADPQAIDNAGNTPAQYSSYASVKTLIQSAVEAKADIEQPSTEAIVIAPEAAKAPELPTSNSGVAPDPSPTKADKLAGALTEAMAALSTEGAAEETNWVAKQAMRRHTSEEPDGWKLATAADEGGPLDSPMPSMSLTGAH